MVSQVFGTLVAAVLVNLVLFTLEFAMACQLFSKKREEVSRWTKFRVWFTLIIDTAATLSSCVFLYMFEESHWDEDEHDEEHERFWQLIIGTLIIGTVSSALAQSYLMERFWRNIRHHLLGTAFAVSLLVLAAIASIASLVTCAYMQWTKAETDNIKPFVWLALISNLVYAVGITAISVCQRFAMRTAGPKPRFLNRVFRGFVETGMPSSIVVILALIAWVVDNIAVYVIALYFVQARIYSCTMLYSLRQTKLVRMENWKEALISTTIAQKPQPVPPLAPEMMVRIEKSGRLTGIPEENQAKWYNIDLSEATRASIESKELEEAQPKELVVGTPRAIVLHRSSILDKQ
ncbi:hypothetical protein MIND_01181400 [Mycena indigotica]|uniref:Transmembrane protein n=1 Tax=Mycena indigotica TaxID=2126181 RepID=A0A8H6S7N6_9AGAR|nr:uncharacterized protein MIND_01181400 [Mycena indigotica]KAF7292825.1 hypothetical protein MIND_01181400 [Mycena indigotica]